MIRKMLLLFAIIIYPAWIIRIKQKIFDEKLKKYIVSMGWLLLVWIFLRILRIYIPSRLLWYCYYIGIIFIPTLYFLCAMYIIGKEKNKVNIPVIIISIVLLITVLTNDIHNLVFIIKDYGYDYDYFHTFGYYIIAGWVFLLLILSTFLIIYNSYQKNKDKKGLLLFVPIIMAFIYTVLYVLKIPYFFREIDMTISLGTIFFITMEINLIFNLIPNNVEYEKIFNNSYLHMDILSNLGKIVYSTKYNMEIPKEVFNDIKNGSVKEQYNNNSSDGIIYKVKSLGNCYSVIEEDYSEIETLKRELEETNAKLKEQEDILLKEKKIKEQIYENKVNNEILNKLEKKMENKRNKIEEILDNMDSTNRDSLNEVKFLLAYCKRISNLIISNYNDEIYNVERQSIILNELLEDSKVFGINGYINFNDIFDLNSIEFSDVYEIIFKTFYFVKDVDVLINVYKTDLSILLDKKIPNVKDYISKSKTQRKFTVQEKFEDDETLIQVKFN